MKTDIHYSINARGYDTSAPKKGAYLATRTTSHFQMGAYKMIAKKAIKRAESTN